MRGASTTKERMLETSAQLFRRQGYSGTGLKQIVAQGEAPIGSLYHFFPGGKDQLGAEALRHSGRGYESLIDSVFARTRTTATAAEAWFQLAAEALEGSDFADGCPIATVALEVASTNGELRQICTEIFASWQAKVAGRLVAEGHSPRCAATLASFALASLEGAIILSRTARDVTALRTTSKIVADALRRTRPS